MSNIERTVQETELTKYDEEKQHGRQPSDSVEQYPES